MATWVGVRVNFGEGKVPGEEGLNRQHQLEGLFVGVPHIRPGVRVKATNQPALILVSSKTSQKHGSKCPHVFHRHCTI